MYSYLITSGIFPILSFILGAGFMYIHIHIHFHYYFYSIGMSTPCPYRSHLLPNMPSTQHSIVGPNNLLSSLIGGANISYNVHNTVVHIFVEFLVFCSTTVTLNIHWNTNIFFIITVCMSLQTSYLVYQKKTEWRRERGWNYQWT